MNDHNHKPGFFQRLRSSAPSLPGMRSLKGNALFLALLSLPLSSPAHAAAYCDGTVANMFTDSGGGVHVLPTFRGNWIQVCNLQTTWKAVAPMTCTLWATTLTSGLLEQKTFKFYYSDPALECSAIPTYADAPPPYYVMINK